VPLVLKPVHEGLVIEPVRFVVPLAEVGMIVPAAVTVVEPVEPPKVEKPLESTGPL
jgi:hypothetical protein